MRLIGDFPEEKEAYSFFLFLSRNQIKSSYESFVDAETKKRKWHIWVYEEDDTAAARDWFLEYQANPLDPKFEKKEILPPPPPPPSIESVPLERIQKEIPSFQVKILVHPKAAIPHSFTNFFIAVCIFLFFLNSYQSSHIVREKGPVGAELLLTPVNQVLMYDYPAAMEKMQNRLRHLPLENYKEVRDLPPSIISFIESEEEMPSWRGVYYRFFSSSKGQAHSAQSSPMFEKIKQGQVWRLFSPTLLHRDFLHILFNMLWLWVLGKQIEERTGKVRFLLLVVVLSGITNLAQYLMSGPYFLGFSGVVVGMAGFIWMRQKMAPWEGYPLNRPTEIFILLFVLGMLVIEGVSLLLQLVGWIDRTPNIANTAHIVGGLTGMLLARIPLFFKEIV